MRGPGRDAADRPARILRALADARAPLSTPELVDLLAEGIPVRARALSRYGQVLRALTATGMAVQAGRTPGAWQRAPAVTWGITGQGRAWLAGHEAGLARADAARPETARLEEEIRRASAERDALLERAREAYGRHTPPDSRARAAAVLSGYGCSLREIGTMFGVSYQQVQQDLLRETGGEPRLEAAS